VPKPKKPYKTYSLLPILSGFVVFISTVIVAMTSLSEQRTISLSGYVTIVNRSNLSSPVIVTTINGQRTTFEIVGQKRSELLSKQGKSYSFVGHVTGKSGSYGPQLEVTSYQLSK